MTDAKEPPSRRLLRFRTTQARRRRCAPGAPGLARLMVPIGEWVLDEACRLALDDFGTGYSALGYLRRFPFDTLKIDRSFVTDLASDGEAQVIVDTIVAMARSLGLRTVAEGVESRLEATMLRDKGCTLLRGWLVSRPLPAASVAPFLAHWHEVARPLLEDAA